MYITPIYLIMSDCMHSQYLVELAMSARDSESMAG